MAESSPNLRSLFRSTLAKEEELQRLGTSADNYHENVKAVISSYRECQRLLERLALFSPNETRDDLATSAIQLVASSLLRLLGLKYPGAGT
jgi:immunoglobulin-binding protein 1